MVLVRVHWKKALDRINHWTFVALAMPSLPALFVFVPLKQQQANISFESISSKIKNKNHTATNQLLWVRSLTLQFHLRPDTSFRSIIAKEWQISFSHLEESTNGNLKESTNQPTNHSLFSTILLRSFWEGFPTIFWSFLCV